MAADHDWVSPARNEARYIFDDDGFTENNAAQNVADGAVWRLPHFLKAELFHARFIGCDGRAFYADTEFANCVCGINGNLVIGLVAIFHAKVVIFQVNIEIGQDETFPDPFPDDASHFVAIEFYNRIFDLNFCHVRKHFPLGRLDIERCHSKVCHMFNWLPQLSEIALNGIKGCHMHRHPLAKVYE